MINPLDHKGLVWTIALRHQGKGMEIDDLVGHGFIGLMHAIRRYDYRAGNTFATFASYWIRQAITRACIRNRMIRIPDYLFVESAKEKRAYAEARSVLDAGWVRDGDGDGYGGHRLADLVADRSGSDADAEEAARSKLVAELLDELPPRLRSVARQYYGIGVEQRNLRQIGEALGVSQPRAQQMMQQALYLMREMLGIESKAPRYVFQRRED